MNTFPAHSISKEELIDALLQIKADVIKWLVLHQVPSQPFGHFVTANHSFVSDELDAATAGIELWVMLGLPLSEEQRIEAIQHLRSYQNPLTGLVIDPTWRGRQLYENLETLEKGDTFFTMTTCEALKALESEFTFPIKYLADLAPADLIAKTDPAISALNPFAIGDYAALIFENIHLGVAGAAEQRKALFNFIQQEQDQLTGLWPRGQVTFPYTPAINRAFHFLRSTWNMMDFPYSFADRMIDSCLVAADDPNYYGWEQGEACNDLDLAFLLYSAAQWTEHRSTDVKNWAASHLPAILRTQKPDGGFSYKHMNAMVKHNMISMSPGLPEGDIWGTLMYMGTIRMMAELAHPGISVPWNFSHVHRIPKPGKTL